MSYEIKNEQEAINVIARLNKTIHDEAREHIPKSLFHFYPSRYKDNQWNALLELGISEGFRLEIGNTRPETEGESITEVVKKFCDLVIRIGYLKINGTNKERICHCTCSFDNGFWRIKNLVYIYDKKTESA
jgi:hypothetical protein